MKNASKKVKEFLVYFYKKCTKGLILFAFFIWNRLYIFQNKFYSKIQRKIKAITINIQVVFQI